MTDEWWQTFFDRTYTETWDKAGSFDATAEEVTGIVTMLKADHAMRILDIPCGFGRHSGALHAMGHDVTGVDASTDQLALAEERNPGPTYVQADMRHPPPGPFDAVLNMFSSIGYFKDRDQDLKAMRAWEQVLTPGGSLLLEAMHRDRIALIHDPEDKNPIGGDGTVEFGTMDWLTGVMNRTVRLPSGEEREFRVNTYTVTELADMADQAGLVDIEVFGDWDGGPVSPQTRLIMRAQRPNLRAA